MPRSHIIRPLLLCPLKQDTELEIPITGDAGVRGVSHEVAPGEWADDVLGELGAQIQKRMRNSENLGYLPGLRMI